MTNYGRILLAGLGSALLLLGALGFQYLGGYSPCTLCLWQRWPHAAAVVIAALAVTVAWRFNRPLSVLGTVAMALGTGLAGYHVGVEQGWWSGPGTCATPSPSAEVSTADLVDQILSTPAVRCDEVTWDFLGLSMAGWNALASLALTLVWATAIRARDPYAT